MSLMTSVRMTSAFVSSLEVLLEQAEDNSGATKGKRESGALGVRFGEQGEGRGGVIIWVRARNAVKMRV